MKAGADEKKITEVIANITGQNIRTPRQSVAHMKPQDIYRDNAEDLFIRFHCIRLERNQIQAAIAHNASDPDHYNMRKAGSRAKATVLEIVSLQDHMLRPIPAIKFKKPIHDVRLQLKSECGHLGPDCQMGKISRSLR